MRAWILGRAITRCDRIFADFIVCTACRDSGPTLLARQIIPADFVVTNYLEHEAVYSNRYTVSSHCLRTRYPPYPRNDRSLGVPPCLNEGEAPRNTGQISTTFPQKPERKDEIKRSRFR